MSSRDIPLTIEMVISWAKSGHESDKVYRFIFLHPEDLFTIPQRRSWTIGHQVVYNGDVNLLKRILALFSDEQINIRTLSRDQKTLLDVAKERHKIYPSMYTYVEHLFLQDDLIQAAKQSNWDLVHNILNKHPKLSNEKPPYSTYFLLHYVVQNGDRRILENLLRRHEFQMNVLSAHNETLIDMAKRLGKTDMYSILEPTKQEELHSKSIKHSLPLSLFSSKSKSNKNPPSSTFSLLPHPVLHPTSDLPYPTIDPFPSASLSNVTLNLSSTGNFTFTKDNKSITIQNESTFRCKYRQPVISPTSKEQLTKNLTCFLTQEIFIDPVIASDGQTYEREAITEWVNLYHCSPMTGASMDAEFNDNTELKQIIQSMKK
ncbi:unnamed protein product [Rotaria sordida]|uniref:U-box domain-containing protein n=1 Tax=Rotaria sordida TaxID=392033 RepID=A0A814IFL4_9BILA|nr:unnamed protein product [Rotaria sordida]CAF1022890.1 unnamed protein product [Rotaria sordida]